MDNGSTTTTATKGTTVQRALGEGTGVVHSPETRALAVELLRSGLSPRDASAAIEATAGVRVHTMSICRWFSMSLDASEIPEWVRQKQGQIHVLCLLVAEEMLHRTVESESGTGAQGFAVSFGIFTDKAQLLAGTGDMRPRYGGPAPARIIAGEGSSSVSSDARERIRARLAAPADPLPSAVVSDDAPPSTDAM